MEHTTGVTNSRFVLPIFVHIQVFFSNIPQHLFGRHKDTGSALGLDSPAPPLAPNIISPPSTRCSSDSRIWETIPYHVTSTSIAARQISLFFFNLRVLCLRKCRSESVPWTRGRLNTELHLFIYICIYFVLFFTTNLKKKSDICRSPTLKQGKNSLCCLHILCV